MHLPITIQKVHALSQWPDYDDHSEILIDIIPPHVAPLFEDILQIERLMFKYQAHGVILKYLHFDESINIIMWFESIEITDLSG